MESFFWSVISGLLTAQRQTVYHQAMRRKNVKQACINCHFFIQNIERHPLEISHEQREAILREDYSQLDQSSLACHFGVWDEGYIADRERRYEVIVQTDRMNYCFFWSFRPGMLLPAAKILQEREASDRETSKDRRYTIIGLWIAAIALGINVLIEVAKIAGWIK